MIEKYSYEQFERDVEQIVQWINKNNLKFTGIYGVPRGGLILAVILSHKLKIPLLTYRLEITNRTLIVDDISDTGETLKDTLLGLRVKPKVVTLFIHTNTKVLPDYFLREKKEDWVHFWWEHEETN